MRTRFARVRGLVAAALGVAVALACGSTVAGVRRSGTWPPVERELVTFSAQGLSRPEAIRRLADKAGWSVVLVEGAPSGTVDVQVTRQPAAKVLELILGDRGYLARRDGDLISIAPVDGAHGEDDDDDDAPAARDDAAAPGSSGARSEPRPHGKDRVVAGNSITIGRDEVVGDLVVMGGSAEVLGQVCGDVAVFAGSLRLREGGHVFGDVATFGGSVELDQGARVDGDLSVVGGSVDRHDKAIVGGHSEGGGEHDDHEGDADGEDGEHSQAARRGHSFTSTVGGAITRTALLFAFGAVLWALAGRRVERLQDEVAARPMRSFALGIVGLIPAALALVVLCVTVIGIPIALFAALASVFGAYAGVCAALTTVGAALVRHKTASPYVHLALGCVAYLILSSIPFVGHFVTAAVILIGFGALIATRGAGLIKFRRANPSSAAADAR